MSLDGVHGFLDVESAALRAPQVGIANSAPQHILSVGSNLYVSGDSPDVLTVDGNVVCEGVKVGLIEIIPSYDLAAVANVGNVTSNTIQFTNPGTGIVTTGNVTVGKTLTVEGFRITAQAASVDTLDSITTDDPAEGKTESGVTSNPIHMTNDTDSVSPYTGALQIGTNTGAYGGLGVAGNVHVGRGVYVGSTLDVAGDVSITGALAVLGTTTTIDTDNLRVKDPIIELGKGNDETLVDLGLVMTRPSGNSNVAMIFDESADILEIGYTNGDASQSTITMDSAPLSVNINGDLSVTSNVEVGTANLFVDTTTGRVGIGKTDPGAALDVSGDVDIAGNIDTTGTVTATNLIRGVVEEPVRWNSQNQTVFPQSTTTRYYKIATLGTTTEGANGGKLRISGTIGGFGEDETTLIDAFVASRGGIKFGGTLTGYGSDNPSDVDFVVYLESNSTFSVWLKVIRFYVFDFTIMGAQISNNTRELTTLPCPTTDTSVATPTGTLQGSVVDSCSVVFTDQGFVGVGTFTPLRKLHVEPGMMVSNNTTGSAILIDNSAQSTGVNDYSYILNASRPGTSTGGAVHFINSSQRTDDGGASAYTIRNDSGPLVIGGNTTGTTTIHGTDVRRANGNSSYMTFGPNATYSSSLVVGATGGGGHNSSTAGVVTTNGNLHLDAGDNRVTYLNYYSGSGTLFGNGVSSAVSAINASGHMGITTTAPNVRLDFGSPLNNRIINLYGSTGDSDSTAYYGFGINSSTLRYNVSSSGEVHKFYGDTTEFGYVNNATGFVSTFTGQHKSFPHETLSGKSVDELSGLIVCASGEHISVNDSIPQRGKDGITVSEAVPIVCLSSYMNEKTVFGVVSNVEDPEDTQRNDRNGAFTSTFKKIVGDTRIYVNSLGEGAVWVCNTNGSLVNGDYITTSNVAGYGQKQDSDTLKNYTVAKITMDCDFRGTLVPKKQIKKKFVTETLQETVEEEYEDNMAEDVYTYDVDGEYYVKTVKDNITTKTRPVMQDYELRDSDGNVITETISKTISTKEYEILVNKEGCVANISGYQNEDGTITVEEYSTLEDRTGYSEIIDNYTQTINQPVTYSGKKIIVKTVTHEVDDLDEHGNLQWEDHPTETETAYKIRYLDADGNITDEANAVHTAAFVGCTYHCG